MPISWDEDRDAAVRRAHRLFRWSLGGWKVTAELPGTAAFDSASSTVREDDVADQIPCGNDVDAVVKAATGFVDAGFTDVALANWRRPASPTCSTPHPICWPRSARFNRTDQPTAPPQRGDSRVGDRQPPAGP